jgi:NitT/TauT family transport system ATP-binding protein
MSSLDFCPNLEAQFGLTVRPISGPGPDRGVVFQSFALFPWKTVLDNVGFGPKMRGVGREARDAIAMEYLQLAGLAHAPIAIPLSCQVGCNSALVLFVHLPTSPMFCFLDEALCEC